MRLDHVERVSLGIKINTSELQWLLQSCPSPEHQPPPSSQFLLAASASLGHEAEVVCIGQVLHVRIPDSAL